MKCNICQSELREDGSCPVCGNVQSIDPSDMPTTLIEGCKDERGYDGKYAATEQTEDVRCRTAAVQSADAEYAATV